MGDKMKEVSKKYTLLDLVDATSVAASDMEWMSTAISIIRKEVTRLHEAAKKGELSQYSLVELRTQIDMFSYLADTRSDYHANESESVNEAFEQEKRLRENAVTAIKL